MQGAATSVLLAASPLLEAVGGRYFEDCNEAPVVDRRSDDFTGVAPYAQAYGLYNMAYSGGALVGPIMGGLIKDSADWGTVGWSLGLITGVTAVTQMIWVGEPLEMRLS